MWDTSKIAAFTSVVSVLLALGGANLNDGQKNAITGKTFTFYSPLKSAVADPTWRFRY